MKRLKLERLAKKGKVLQQQNEASTSVVKRDIFLLYMQLWLCRSSKGIRECVCVCCVHVSVELGLSVQLKCLISSLIIVLIKGFCTAIILKYIYFSRILNCSATKI